MFYSSIPLRDLPCRGRTSLRCHAIVPWHADSPILAIFHYCIKDSCAREGFRKFPPPQETQSGGTLEALFAAELIDIGHIAAPQRVGSRRCGARPVEEIEHVDRIGKIDIAIIVGVERILAIDLYTGKQVADNLDPIADIDGPIDV